MERREFLKLGGLSTLGVAAPAVAAAAPPDPLDERSVEVAVLNLDAGLASIRARLTRRIDADKALGRNTEIREAMRTLVGGYYAYQAFSELPIEMQVHPDLQERIGRAADDIDAGVDALRVALDDASPQELDALERIWAGGHDGAVADVERSYAGLGGTVAGRRRFQRLADLAARDVRRKGVRGTLTAYLDEIDAIRKSPPPPRRLDRVQLERARRGQRRWKARAPRPPEERTEHYDPVPARNPGVAKASGILMILLGGASIVVGALTIMCPCIGVPFILLGIVLIVLGAKLIRRADAAYREEYAQERIKEEKKKEKAAGDGADDGEDF